jgi:hypothetical protein
LVQVPKDPQEQRQWMLEVLVNNYGIPGHVIDPDNQVIPLELSQAVEPETKGQKPEAEILKKNERLDEVVSYLRERHAIFLEGTIEIDCPIHPWFGKTNPPDLSMYQGVFRIVPRKHGYLAFTCKPDCTCQWTQCPIHPSQPFADQRFDPFDLLQVLDSISRGFRFPNRYGTTADYAKELSQALRIPTKRLRAKTSASYKGLGRYRGMRYPANRNQLLIEISSCVPLNDKDVQDFIDRIWRMVWLGKKPEPVFDQTRSTTTVWFPESSATTFRKSGAASRLWLYLWILQQQERKHVVADLESFAEVLAVTRDKVYRYARSLEKSGVLIRKKKMTRNGEVELWSVKA